MSDAPQIEAAFAEAVALARRGADEAALAAYLRVLSLDPAHFAALNDLGGLLHALGRRSAAKVAYRQASALHPNNPVAWVNLGHLLFEDGDPAGAETHYRAALAADAEFFPAHQGLARVLSERGEDAELHWRKGFVGHALHRRPCRGPGAGIPVVLLISARLGNMATRRWLDDRIFAITEVLAEFFDPAEPLPDHRLLVNAIGDADLCAAEFAKAEALAARSAAPVINAPRRVAVTGRSENDRRLAQIPGVRTAGARLVARVDLLGGAERFPLLLRAPGFHTGRHFLRVAARSDLPAALDQLPGGALFVLDPLDARGADGLFRKYRAIFVDGRIYPLHLAISRHWLVHYFSSDMATSEAFREEERRFLQAMPEVLGAKAFAALQAIERDLSLDYGGVDFGLAPDGSLLLFEANAAMNVFPPAPEPIWDYRRAAVETILDAARDMALRRAAL
jgi:hypothetical protein